MCIINIRDNRRVQFLYKFCNIKKKAASNPWGTMRRPCRIARRTGSGSGRGELLRKQSGRADPIGGRSRAGEGLRSEIVREEEKKRRVELSFDLLVGLDRCRCYGDQTGTAVLHY